MRGMILSAHSLSEVKILYVFRQEGFMPEPQPVAFVGKHKQEWILDAKIGS